MDSVEVVMRMLRQSLLLGNRNRAKVLWIPRNTHTRDNWTYFTTMDKDSFTENRRGRLLITKFIEQIHKKTKMTEYLKMEKTEHRMSRNSQPFSCPLSSVYSFEFDGLIQVPTYDACTT